MGLFHFGTLELLVRSKAGPLHVWHYGGYLGFPGYMKGEGAEEALRPLLLAGGFVEASSMGAIGARSYTYKGVRLVDVSEGRVASEMPLTSEEIAQRKPAREFQEKAIFRCVFASSDGPSEDFPRHLPGYGPQFFHLFSTTRALTFWVDPEQKDRAQAHLEQRGWKPTAFWKGLDSTPERQSQDRDMIRKMLKRD